MARTQCIRLAYLYYVDAVLVIEPLNFCVSHKTGPRNSVRTIYKKCWEIRHLQTGAVSSLGVVHILSYQLGGEWFLDDLITEGAGVLTMIT